MNLDTLKRARAELQSEAERIATAIEKLDALLGALAPSLRSRVSHNKPVIRTKRKPKWTKAQRAEVSRRMKAYWAARRK